MRKPHRFAYSARMAAPARSGVTIHEVVTQCVETLKTLEAWFDKAERHAAVKGFDASVLLASRLAPDMFDFIYQVQSTCDYVKGAAAWLSGQTPPRHPDDEKTLGELRARIRKTVAFVDTVTAAQYSGASERKVRLSWAPGKVLSGPDYLLQITLPNVFFHASMAYAILRHNGVDVGKMDFLGAIRFVDE